MNAPTVLLLTALTLPLPAFAGPQAGGTPPASEGMPAEAAPVSDPAANEPGRAPNGERAAIVLGPELDGRFMIYDANGSLITSLFKPAGRTVELGLEPGRYDIVCEREPLRLDTRVTLGDRERRTLERQSFREVEPVAVAEQGHHHHHAKEEEPKGLFMKGRTRVELFGGFTDSYVEVEDHYGSHVQVGGGQGGMDFTHWVREDLALEFQLLATNVDVLEIDHGPWEETEARGSSGLLFGARYYFPKPTFGGSFRPYLSAAAGPFSDYSVYDDEHHTEVHHDHTRFGAQLGGGVDFQLSRLFSLGVRMAVLLHDGHDTSFGATFGFGFAWGKGKKS